LSFFGVAPVPDAVDTTVGATSWVVNFEIGVDEGTKPFEWEVTACEPGLVNCGPTSDRREFTVTKDIIAPRVDSFTINSISFPTTVNANSALTIAWTSSDMGGSGKDKDEVWRAPDSSGSPGTWVRIIDSATSPASDNPADDTWWYGIHTKDNANNCIDEAGDHACGGVSSDGLDPRTIRGPIQVVMDKTVPILAQIIPVPTPTDDTTPNYTFSSTEAGTITYGGDCSSSTTAATAGNNTVIFNTLAEGAHTNCTITVTDAVGNPSVALSVSSFTVDIAPPQNLPNTSINSGPSDPTTSTTATFTFSGTNSPTSFQCQLDGGGFSSCTSPKSYSGLSEGLRTFHVKAINAVGEDSSPAPWGWTVALGGPPQNLPNTSINSGPSDPTSSIKLTLKRSGGVGARKGKGRSGGGGGI